MTFRQIRTASENALALTQLSIERPELPFASG